MRSRIIASLIGLTVVACGGTLDLTPVQTANAADARQLTTMPCVDTKVTVDTAGGCAGFDQLVPQIPREQGYNQGSCGDALHAVVLEATCKVGMENGQAVETGSISVAVQGRVVSLEQWHYKWGPGDGDTWPEQHATQWKKVTVALKQALPPHAAQ